MVAGAPRPPNLHAEGREEEVHVLRPKRTLKVEADLVALARADRVDRVPLPLRQRRHEVHRALLQARQRQGDDGGVRQDDPSGPRAATDVDGNAVARASPVNLLHLALVVHLAAQARGHAVGERRVALLHSPMAFLSVLLEELGLLLQVVRDGFERQVFQDGHIVQVCCIPLCHHAFAEPPLLVVHWSLARPEDVGLASADQLPHGDGCVAPVAHPALDRALDRGEEDLALPDLLWRKEAATEEGVVPPGLDRRDPRLAGAASIAPRQAVALEVPPCDDTLSVDEFRAQLHDGARGVRARAAPDAASRPVPGLQDTEGGDTSIGERRGASQPGEAGADHRDVDDLH
mmetsp:Transcript_67830/g.196202  ORF Transcript_67830/g.196202 Transcript_67830/m.196202 type:complete len:346 (-) Transcript_67830:185-1222(-)